MIFTPRNFLLLEFNAINLSMPLCHTYTFSCFYHDVIEKCNTTLQLYAVNLQKLPCMFVWFSRTFWVDLSVYRCMFKLADVQLRYLVVIFTRVAASNFKCSSHRFVYFLWFSTNASFFDRLHDFSNVVFVEALVHAFSIMAYIIYVHF